MECDTPLWKKWLEFRHPWLNWLQQIYFERFARHVEFTGDVNHLWREAAQHAPMSFRWFGRTLALKDVDDELGHFEQWIKARRLHRPGDKIWPYRINPATLAMRIGYVIVRKGQPVTGVVLISS